MTNSFIEADRVNPAIHHPECVDSGTYIIDVSDCDAGVLRGDPGRERVEDIH